MPKKLSDDLSNCFKGFAILLSLIFYEGLEDDSNTIDPESRSTSSISKSG